ncbi:MAG TPA: YfiR family protein [Candidatus Acidoferrales bacterium]|jgi:hypothetical protein|nr:YfiR family protein [Candidatus Acidoferrales bacterium]
MLLLSAALLLFPAYTPAQQYQSGEYELKAAILYNLVKFVDWPPQAYSTAQAPTVLCTLGHDPFGPALDRYSGTTVNGRPLVIRRLERDQNTRGCHLLFITSSERKLLARVFETLQGEPILTVGEVNQFADRGGMVQLALEDKQVHFSINLTIATREQLRIRSNLLALSRIVESKPGATQVGFVP